MELDNWGIKLNSYYTFEHNSPVKHETFSDVLVYLLI